MFRINSITFHNFRNILDSEIKLTENGFKTDMGGYIVGIYGTNSSSKSSVGYALSYFSKLVCGISYAFFHDFKNDFGINDDVMSIEYDFDYLDEKLSDSSFTGLIIKFVFKKEKVGENDFVQYISEESIKVKTSIGRPISYRAKRSNNYLVNSIEEKELERIVGLFSTQDIAVAINSDAIQKQSSYFLNAVGLKLVLDAINKNNEKPTKELKYLSSFVRSYINKTSFIMPDSYGLSITNNLFAIIGGETTNTELVLKEPNGFYSCTADSLEKIEKNISISNRFMNRVFNNFNVGVEKKELETDINNKITKYQIRFISYKKEGSFPFENESEGIKRLFLISAAISKVMNTTDYILFIDEMDEGVFEVLFGDIIKNIESQCMGQFIFTSHNLRPLEVLNYTHFIFATINPNNRFVTVKGIKPLNNLRDIYIRKIMYGSSEGLSNYVTDNAILGGLIDA